MTELDFSVVAVDVDGRTSNKDIGCYVHMDSQLLDVITPIREKIGRENTLTVAVADRPTTLKLIVKRMGDLEELLGSASIPISILISPPVSDFRKLWVKLSNDPDSDLFIPTVSEEPEKPRLQVAFRTRNQGNHAKVEKNSKNADSAIVERDENRLFQERIWQLESELAVVRTELKFEQEKTKESTDESLQKAGNRINDLERQLKAAVEGGISTPVFISSDTSPPLSIVTQYRAYLDSQRQKEQLTETHIYSLISENSALKTDLAAKQHQISTLVNEITYLHEVLNLEKAAKTDQGTEAETSANQSGESKDSEEVLELRQLVTELQTENAKLRKDIESRSFPGAKTGSDSSKTPKNFEYKGFSPKKPAPDPVEIGLNQAAVMAGFTNKFNRVVEGVYLLGNKRIHAKLQGIALMAQVGGTAEWLPAEELMMRLKEDGELKSLRRSISVGQESDIRAEGQTPPKQKKGEDEEAKTKPVSGTSKIMREFSPILKKKK